MSVDSPSTEVYRFENVELGTARGQLVVGGKVVELEPRPMRLLLEFLRHTNEVLTKEELLQSVWDGRVTVEHVLANAVSKLRTALGPAGAARLQTVPRVGYRLQGPVQRVAERAPSHRFEPDQPVPLRDNFLLVGPLGEGAKSDVWLARHTKLCHARVFKFADDGERLSALKREYTLNRVLRQELGPRPDFAVVLDANFVAAPFFLECEFGGLSLLEWAERPVPGQPGGQLQLLSTDERIDLLRQTAAAVAAAHSVGVLHKDIKPGNVLVQETQGRLQVKLTDFGSGRLLDPARLEALGLTALGLTQTRGVDSDSRSGTWMYMAPETLAGQSPTVQSDVYGLGIVLWQLLVGDLRRPMATGWERSIGDELLRADIAGATEGDPAARFVSAAELVHRLERLEERRELQRAALQREEESLAATQLLQRRKARRPWVVAAVALLLMGLLVSLWMQARTESALAHSEVATSRANRINDFLTHDVLMSSDIFRATGGKQPSMLAVLRRASTQAGLRFVGQPHEEATIRRQLGRAFMRLASFTYAQAEFAAAIDLLRSTGASTGDDDRILALRAELIAVLTKTDQLDTVGRELNKLETEIGATRLGSPSELALFAQYARVLIDLHAQRNDEALKRARALVALADSLPGLDTELMLNVRSVLAQAYLQTDQIDAAEAVFARSGNVGAGNESLAESTLALASVSVANHHKRAGRFEDARKILTRAQARLVRSPGVNQLHLGWVLAELGDLSVFSGDFEGVARFYTPAVSAFLESVGADHQFTNVAARNVAEAQLHLGRYEDALKRLAPVRDWAQAHTGPHFQREVDTIRARALIGLKRHREALEILDPMPTPQVDPGAEPGDPRPWARQMWRGAALVGQGRKAEGRSLMLQALPVLQKPGTPAWEVAMYEALIRIHR
jgi:non-specific serine/threonine protein kinase